MALVDAVALVSGGQDAQVGLVLLLLSASFGCHVQPSLWTVLHPRLGHRGMYFAWRHLPCSGAVAAARSIARRTPPQVVCQRTPPVFLLQTLRVDVALAVFSMSVWHSSPCLSGGLLHACLAIFSMPVWRSFQCLSGGLLSACLAVSSPCLSGSLLHACLAVQQPAPSKATQRMPLLQGRLYVCLSVRLLRPV